jgi:hypothetical protein
MAESSQIIEQAEALLRRVSPEGRRQAKRARERRRKAAMRVATRMVYVLMAVIAAAIAWGLIVGPIGTTGVLIAGLALIIGWMAVAHFSQTPEYTPDALVHADVRLLPSRTEEWLLAQRPALPAPAQRLADSIGLKLEAMGPQLATVELDPPSAAALRKLMGEELPELIGGYQRVPVGLRRETRGGLSPDKQLLDGLTTVDEELSRMSEQLARGDLDKLATQQRYLELKYKGDEELGG